MRKTIIALGLAVMALSGVTYLYAQDPGFGPGHRGMPRQESWCREKWDSLAPEQKTEFQNLRNKFNEEIAPLRKEMVTKRLELQSLWTNPTADPIVITAKEKELRDLQNQMRDKMIQYRLEARNFLTPEQITEFGTGCGMGSGFRGGRMMGSGRGIGTGRGPGMWQ